jgi:TPR repeat protein
MGRAEYAHFLMMGVGVMVDLPKSASYMKMTADQGDTDAEYTYGLHLSADYGVKAYLVKSASYMKMGADQGQVDGLREYGMAQPLGNGVKLNESEGMEWNGTVEDGG